MIECVVCGAQLDPKQMKKGKTIVCPDCSMELHIVSDTLVLLKLGNSKKPTA